MNVSSSESNSITTKHCSTKALSSIEELIALYDNFGEEHYGEGISQDLHMRQCAAFAQREGAKETLVLAALLHDVGHFSAYANKADFDQDFHHERVAYQLLKNLFDDAIIMPIAYHVVAKRYLCASNAEYAMTLSSASKQSLALQGGPLDRQQIKKFEQNPYFEDAIALRLYDDEGKIIGHDAPPLSAYLPLIQKHVKATKV